MKKIFPLLLILLAGYISQAQQISDIGKIPVAIAMPDHIDGLDAANVAKLETKMIQVVTASGFASDGYNSEFAIFPKFAVNESNMVEGGMQNITVVSADLTLFIRQVNNGIIISSVTMPLKGSGANAAAAAGNAISKIAADDAELKNFIKSGKEKIVAYYDSRCSDLMAQADNMAAKQNYEDALAVLMSVPEAAKGCYKAAQLKVNDLYKRYENKHCQGLVSNAKIKIAAAQYTEALELLGQVDPSSACGAQARDLIIATGNKVAQEQKKQWDMALKIYDDDIALEKYRINALKEIAVATQKKTRRSRHSSEE